MGGAWRWLVLGGVVGAVGCSGPLPEPQDVCAAVTCGAGRCVVDQGVAACLCDEAFRAEGLTCVPRAVDPCASNPCAGQTRSACVADAGVARCECPTGRVDVDGVCVVRTPCTPNPCTQAARRTVCEVVGGAARCLCEPGYAPVGEGCATTPTWSCAAQHTGPDEDSAEPNECPAQAWQLAAGAPAETYGVRPAGDHDWFAVPTVPGHLYAVWADVTGGAPTLQLELFDAAGLTLLAADTAGDGTALVRFRAPQQGPQLARVRGQRASDVFSYAIRYEDQGIDDYADVTEEATALSPGARFSGEVQFAGDLDVAWLALPSATAVLIDMQGGPDGGARPDVVLDLLLADAGAGRRLVYERTVVTVPADDALLLVARGRNLQDLGPFDVVTADLGVDDHSDDFLFGTPVQPSASAQAAAFERPDDRDVVRFRQVAGHIYQARCTLTVSTYSGCQAQALTTQGGLLDGMGSTAPVWQAKTSEDVLAAFSRPGGYGQLTSAAYTWVVEDLGVDDHPDPPAAGTPVTAGTPVGGRLELPTDVDAFSFTAVGGHVLRVAAAATGVSLQVDLQTAGGQAVANGSDSAAALVQVTGTYRATVRRSYSYASGVVPYTVVVSDLGADDHGNLSTLATAVTPGQPASGDLQYPTDSDWFSAGLTANHVYQVTCVTATGACPVQIIDPSGIAVSGSYYGSGPQAFLARQSGVASFEVRAGYSTPTGPYTLTLTDLGLEDHSDALASATPYPTLGTGLAGALRYQGDLDVFRFTGTAGHVYALACTGPASCPVELLDATGAVLASATYSASVARGLASTSGTYYARVGGAYASSLFSYTLTVTDEGTDDHANSASGATPIVLGTPVTGQVQYQGDVDVLAFTATVDRLYRVDCVATAGQCGLSVRTATTTVGQAYPSTRASVSFKAPAAALSVEVSAGGTATWSVEVTDLGVDDHGDTAATGTALTLGAAPTAGTIEVPGDVDVFTVAGVAANDVLAFTCTSATGCRVDVRGPSGVLVTSDYAYGATPLQLGFRAGVPGTYAFAVTAYGSSGTAPYTVQVATGSDDHGDTVATATALTLGVPASGVINFSTDVDVFTFAATAGAQRTVTLSGSYVRAQVLSPTGGYVANIYANSSYPYTFTPSTAGTYSVHVARDYSAAGAYQVTVN